MPEQATLEALRDAFWPLYVISVTVASLSFVLLRKWCLGRAVLALLAGSVAQWAWEGSGYLAWWQHMAIDVPIFILITHPPRHYWQATLGAMVFAQLVLHAAWGVVPELAREHWLVTLGIGYAKCFVLLLWAGGGRVERALDRVSRFASRMVLDEATGKLF